MNISKEKLKEIIQEELNVLLGIEPPSMIYDPGPERADLSSKNINHDLLASAEKAADTSFIVTDKLNKVITMLEHTKRGDNLTNVQAKVVDALDSINDVVNELNTFHKNNNQEEV
jgi:hypothetical protein